MSIFNEFPYTNFHEINLDWILKTIKELEKAMADFSIKWGEEISENVDQWLTEHPEATTTVQDNSLTTAKYQDGSITGDKIANNTISNNKLTNTNVYNINGVNFEVTPLKKSSYNREHVAKTQMQHYIDITTYPYFQSAVLNPATNHVFLGFCDNSHVNCKIVEIDTDNNFYTVVNTSNVLQLGHINDMAFYNGNLYIATGNSGSYANSIVIVNPSTLTIVNSIPLTYAAWEISHDDINDVFYIGGPSLYIYDNAIANIITTIPWENLALHTNGEAVTAQGSFCYNGCYVQLWSAEQSYYFTTYNLDTGVIECIHKYKATTKIEELEAAIVLNDKLYTFGGNRYLEILRHDLDYKSSDAEISDVFYTGKVLADGTNIDSVRQVGKYVSVSAATSATMTNAPVTNRGFTLYTLAQGWDWLTQLAIVNSSFGMMYIRTKEGTNAWSDWKALHGEYEVLNPNNPITISGTVQIPAHYINQYEQLTIAVYDSSNHAGSIVLPTRLLTAGHAASGVYISANNGGYWQFNISSSGLMTMSDYDTIGAAYVAILGK